MNEKDAEALDAVTIGAWNWGMGERHVRTESISDLRQRFIDFQRTKLADGRVGRRASHTNGGLANDSLLWACHISQVYSPRAADSLARRTALQLHALSSFCM